MGSPDDPSVPGGLACWLRERVLRLRMDSRRQVFPPRLELVAATPMGLDEPVLAARTGVHTVDDHALRVELLDRMLGDAELASAGPVAPRSRPVGYVGGGSADSPFDGHAAVCLVYVRSGPPETGDSDIAWWAAARCQAGMTPWWVERVVAVTRWGWLDVASGERRTWTRLRA